MNENIFFFFNNLSGKIEFFDQLVVFFAEVFPYFVIFFAFLFLIFHNEILFSENPLKAFIKKWKEIFR